MPAAGYVKKCCNTIHLQEKIQSVVHYASHRGYKISKKVEINK